MSRPRGGYIGFNRVPAAAGVNSAASGIWTLREAEALKRAGTWPLPLPVPQTISGLQLWLDASDASTLYDATSGGSLVAADGGVARWEDKSGNARHATQGTAANRPARKTAVQNGLDVIRGDGTDDVLATSAFSSDLVRSVFVVAISQETPQGVAYTILLGQADSNIGSGSNDAWFFGTTNSGTGGVHDRLRCVIRNSGDTALVQDFVDDAFVTGVPFMASYINNGTGIYRYNDTAKTFSTASQHLTASVPLSILAPQSFYYWDGDICEIIIYNSALSDVNRTLVENYLLAKWGIT